MKSGLRKLTHCSVLYSSTYSFLEGRECSTAMHDGSLVLTIYTALCQLGGNVVLFHKITVEINNG